MPGLQATATLSVGGSSNEVGIPVVNGVLEEYRPYVPGGFSESELSHLTPSPKSEEHH